MPSGQDAEQGVQQASEQNVKPAAGKVASQAEPAARELTDKQVCGPIDFRPQGSAYLCTASVLL